MEDLNKTQMVLLCLLVSFVTSIGTGIITTSLLREVPQNVTQTINRVVERTVETVAPQTTNTNTVTREVTVVVKEEDLIIDSIKKSRNSIVRITKSPSGSGSSSNSASTQGIVQTVGVVVKKDGTILTDKRFIDDESNYRVTLPGATDSVPFKIAWVSETSNAAFLTPVLPAGSTQTFSAMPISSADSAQLGQTVIAVGGKDKEAVAIGRLNSINYETALTATSTKSVTSIETDTPLRDLVAGSILLNLNGSMLGFESFDRTNNSENIYASINSIKKEKPEFFE